MKVSKIERVADGGIRVTLADGSTATYANAALVPDEISQLMGRMDSLPEAAEGERQADSGQDAAAAARSAYMARLEAAYEPARLRDPGQGLSGQAAYVARLEARWQEKPTEKRINAHKFWAGA